MPIISEISEISCPIHECTRNYLRNVQTNPCTNFTMTKVYKTVQQSCTFEESFRYINIEIVVNEENEKIYIFTPYSFKHVSLMRMLQTMMNGNSNIELLDILLNIISILIAICTN